MSWAPPEDDERMARNLEHVRAIRAALVANDYTELTTATPADLDASEAAERRRHDYRLRLAAAEARAAQVADDEAAQALSEDSDNLAEVIPLRPTAEGNGK